jgi:hypothetical protein
LAVTASNISTIVGTYRPIQGASLRVNLGPADAITAGARWFIVGESNTWASSEMASLAPCGHLVSLAPLPGFETPAAQPVTLTYGRTNVLTLNYRRLPVLSLTRQGDLSLTLRLSGSIGATYEVQIRPDLSPGSVWTNLLTTNLANQTELIAQTLQTNRGSLFYRAVLKP